MTVCGRCRIDKPNSEFYKNAARQNGLSTWCKECRKLGNIEGPKSRAALRECFSCGLTRPSTEFKKSKLRHRPCDLCIETKKVSPSFSLDLPEDHQVVVQRQDFRRERMLRTTYGISIEEYDELLRSQDGGCAGCLAKPTTKRLAVDHCHTTGKVRGLLCTACNLSLGHLKEDLATIQRLMEYLKNHAA
jgi:hypothetical protein